MTEPNAPAPFEQAFRAWQEQSRLLERIQIGFIVGPPKTGTSWVTSTLHAHPAIVARGEGHLATRLVPAITQAMHAYAAAQGGTRRASDKPPPPWVAPDQRDALLLARQAIDRMLVRYLATSGKSRVACVLDKTPDHARHMDLLGTLYPRARFICVTRDVRDAAVSAWFYRVLLGETAHFRAIDDFAPAYARDVWAPMMALARRSGAALGPTRYLEISYEDYTRDGRAVIASLLRFLALPSDDREVDACLESAAFKRQAGRDAGVEAKSFYRKGVVGDWANHLDATVASRTLDVAHEILARAAAPAPIPTSPAA